MWRLVTWLANAVGSPARRAGKDTILPDAPVVTEEGPIARPAMTEAEWLASDDPARMLTHGPPSLRRLCSARKLRLVAAGWCRQAWPVIDDERIWRAVEAAEAVADGQNLSAGMEALWTGIVGVIRERESRSLTYRAAWAAWSCLHDSPFWAAAEVIERLRNPQRYPGAPLRWAVPHAAALLRCVVRCSALTPLAPSWLIGSVPMLAQAAYLERHLPAGDLDPARLGVLSDALEEAGCTDAALLGHLRTPGPHVRGCWAVDLILGKA